MYNRNFRKITTTVLLLCILSVNCEMKNPSNLALLVPRIDQPNFQLTPNGQQYTLYINLPDGSTRRENVELRAPGTPDVELHVTGTINVGFPAGTAITVYEAGRNGYTVKYSYVASTVEQAIRPFFVSATALKTAAG